jgi:hypothetical protein
LVVISDDEASEVSEELAFEPEAPAKVDKKGKGKAVAEDQEESLMIESDGSEGNDDDEIAEDEFVLLPYPARHWLTNRCADMSSRLSRIMRLMRMYDLTFTSRIRTKC